MLTEHRGSLADAERDVSYRWAAPAVAGRDVLDVGSGGGHGAALLVDAGARSVVGLEPSGAAVKTSSRAHAERAALRFVIGEPEALPAPFASGTFGALTCFGPLERGADPELRIETMKILLVDGGVLLASLPLQPPREPIAGRTLGKARDPGQWRELLSRSFANVRIHRRRTGLASAVLALEGTGADQLDGPPNWLGADSGEDWSVLAVASDGDLPELSGAATLIGARDLRAYRETIAAWEQRARRAEADGSAKHWELVASREAQRRLRKRLWYLEHTRLRKLVRVLRGRPARLSEGPPIRPPELEAEPWE